MQHGKIYKEIKKAVFTAFLISFFSLLIGFCYASKPNTLKDSSSTNIISLEVLNFQYYTLDVEYFLPKNLNRTSINLGFSSSFIGSETFNGETIKHNRFALFNTYAINFRYYLFRRVDLCNGMYIGFSNIFQRRINFLRSQDYLKNIASIKSGLQFGYQQKIWKGFYLEANLYQNLRWNRTKRNTDFQFLLNSPSAEINFSYKFFL
jgi:hypothetical protein